jgi:hypothetical protein
VENVQVAAKDLPQLSRKPRLPTNNLEFNHNNFVKYAGNLSRLGQGSRHNYTSSKKTKQK